MNERTYFFDVNGSVCHIDEVENKNIIGSGESIEVLDDDGCVLETYSLYSYSEIEGFIKFLET